MAEKTDKQLEGPDGMEREEAEKAQGLIMDRNLAEIIGRGGLINRLSDEKRRLCDDWSRKCSLPPFEVLRKLAPAVPARGLVQEGLQH